MMLELQQGNYLLVGHLLYKGQLGQQLVIFIEFSHHLFGPFLYLLVIVRVNLAVSEAVRV